MRATLLGCEIERVDISQAVSACEQFVDSRRRAQHMAVNAAKLVAMNDDSRLREIVERCELVTADGQSIVWASRLLGDPVPERVAGIDLMQRLLARAEERGYGVYILGARAEVLDRAVARILDRYPRLRIVGYHDGYFDESCDHAVVNEVRAARPDILFVAMSSPRKEYFLGENRRELNVPFVMGVGGAIDVMAGVTRRAPRLVQRLGLEWLYRLVQEPRRLGPRYVVTNSRFVLLVARALVAKHRRRVGTS